MKNSLALELGEAFKLKGNQGIGTIFTESKGIRGFISDILPNVFIVAGIIMLFLIIFGGVGMIIQAGNPEARQKSQGVVTNAIMGFVIIFAAFWIVQIIQKITGAQILN